MCLQEPDRIEKASPKWTKPQIAGVSLLERILLRAEAI
jgi:hypothetical protein